jgi:hypothetical protein
MSPRNRNKKRRGSFDPSKTTTLRQAFYALHGQTDSGSEKGD